MQLLFCNSVDQMSSTGLSRLNSSDGIAVVLSEGSIGKPIFCTSRLLVGFSFLKC